MNEREQRGLQIAALFKLVNKGDYWLVPSQSGRGEYKVKNDPDTTSCTCPYFQSHPVEKCKHVYAVEITERRESGAVTPEQIAAIPLRAKKVYTQNWPAYRLAQINEKAKFLELLHELCSGVDEPIQSMGRARLPMSDMIFAAAFKIYSTVSSRRFMTDLKEAYLRQYISKKPCYNSINNYIEMEELTPHLKWLVARSSLPLTSVEADFAVDSSGFSTSKHERWHDEKYGKEKSERDWVKAHIMCGVKTNIITAAEITGAHASDHNYFVPLFNETAKRFGVKEVSADKAYSSYRNMIVADRKDAMPYIDFKINSTGRTKCLVWNRMYHFYSLNNEKFKEHYNKRSNVESTFNLVKAKFGAFVRSKLQVAQFNEVLCKILCHNICCLIQSQYELGIEATFWAE